VEIVSERELVSRLGALPWAEPRAVVSGNFATPFRLMELFDSAVESYRLFALNAQPGMPTRAGVIPESPFVGPAMRDLAALDYLPMRLSLVPMLFDVARPPDVVLLHTSVPRDGKVSLGLEVNILPAAIERLDYRAIDARPIEGASPRVLAPELPAERSHTAGEVIDISTPELPPSPRELLAAEQERNARRAELFRMLGTYTQLQHEIDPAYQLASAHMELSLAVGAVNALASEERVAEALEWTRQQVAEFALKHPEQFKNLARAHRRLALASRPD